MISKILKIELFVLFLLTVVSFFGYYYKDVLPDNYFFISSNSQTLSSISYFFTTAIVFIGYYSGPWIFFPFIFFSLFYAFQYSKREYFCDLFNVATLTFAFLFGTYLFYPTVLGFGVYSVMKQAITPVASAFLFIFWLSLFFAGSFRSTFKERVIQLARFVFGSPHLIGKFSSKLTSFKMGDRVQGQGKKISSLVKVNVPRILQGQKKKEDPVVSEALSGAIDEPFEQELPEQEDLPEQMLPLQQEEPEVKKAPAPRPRVQPKLNEKEYFQMVSTISQSKKHEAQPETDVDYFNSIANSIEEKLLDFRIEGKIVDVLKGPVVDTFLLELGKGVKVSKVTNIYQDISVALYGAPIRIVYPMRGRTTVGIEVPRNPREIIYLDEVLNSKIFKKAEHTLPIAMGKDAFGEVFVVDLASMPHMLVAGATGSGKSVFINSLLVSLLVKKSPAQMKLILIDPKQLELALYSRLPHLAMPVVVDAKTASLSLMWCVQEMERRYAILKAFGVRNLDGFNRKLKGASADMVDSIRRHYTSDEQVFELPYIVVIVDEFADLILTKAGKEIENNICRLAGKARAAGIHLVIATQRPSVDVITGLIKSNFPTRVSFKVTTNIDSRTILSATGAERLLGKGDMLYKRGVDTSRVHSSYVDENEIEALVDNLARIECSFDQGAIEFMENGGEDQEDPYAFGSHIASAREESGDSKYDEAVQVVMEHNAASASMLQRRLKIGYNRAANLIEEMERRGVVGPAQGAKPRKVLLSSSQG